jgi:NADH dehydrogenase [ubiquinone] 1 alpha subcomplex assembly factor 6
MTILSPLFQVIFERAVVRNSLPSETQPLGARSGPPPDESSLADLVRRHDRDRYQTALFAPAERRGALLALYAFNYEIARVREIVSEPMLGQIRLQWWREVLDAAYAGTPPRSHPVVVPLAAAIREFELSRGYFDRLIDSRERDLADVPPASLAILEAYAEESSASLIHLALEVLGMRPPALDAVARHVGIGYALTGLLRAMRFHAQAGRTYIPVDIAQREGLDPGDYAAGRAGPALRAVVRAIANTAASHLRAGRESPGEIPRSALAALLPAVVASRHLARLQQAGYDPFAPALAAPDPLQIWRLSLAALRGRF